MRSKVHRPSGTGNRCVDFRKYSQYRVQRRVVPACWLAIARSVALRIKRLLVVERALFEALGAKTMLDHAPARRNNQSLPQLCTDAPPLQSSGL